MVRYGFRPPLFVLRHRIPVPPPLPNPEPEVTGYLGDEIFVDAPTGVAATDTAALQEAFTLGHATNRTVVMLTGTYVTNAALVFGDPDGGASTQHKGSLRGQGRLATVIDYNGPSNGTALSISHHYDTMLQGFSVTGPGSGAADSVGIEFGRDGAGPFSGTQTHGLLIQEVGVSDFETGWQFGIGGVVACSEMTMINTYAINCVTGISVESANTLNLQFMQLALSDCERGLYCTTGGSVFVYGGAGSSNDLTFDLRPGGAFGIYGFRDESSWFCHIAGTTAFTAGSLIGCTTSGLATYPDMAVTTGWGAELAVIDCIFLGGISHGSIHDPSGGITMIRTGVCSTRAFWNPDGGSIDPFQYQILGCKRIDSAGNPVEMFPDEIGITLNTGERLPTLSNYPTVKEARLTMLGLGDPDEMTEFSVPTTNDAIHVRMPTGEVYPITLGAAIDQPDPTGEIAGCYAWYEADRQEDAVEDEDLETLEDSTNYRRTLSVSPDAGSTPTYRIDGVDDLPYVQFRGEQKHFRGSVVSLAAGDRTFFLLVRIAEPEYTVGRTGDQDWIRLEAFDHALRIEPDDATPRAKAISSPDDLTYTPGVDLDTWKLFTMREDGVTSTFRVNGVEAEAGTLAARALTRFELGPHCDGDWRLAVHYERALSDAEIDTFEAWAMTKYGL